MGLASLPGKLEEYLDLQRDGLTAIELDVKDENGQVAFTSRPIRLLAKRRSCRDFYSPRAVALLAHERWRLSHRTRGGLRGPDPVARTT